MAEDGGRGTPGAESKGWWACGSVSVPREGLLSCRAISVCQPGNYESPPGRCQWISGPLVRGLPSRRLYLWQGVIVPQGVGQTTLICY